MDSDITIPESVKFYFQDDANSNAINQMVALNRSPKKGSTGLSWEELQSLNKAKLAAVKTQVDFWDLMNQIWCLTWGAEIGKLPSASEIEMKDYGKYRDLNSVWDGGETFFKHYYIAEGDLYLGVSADEEGIYLYCYFEDENGTYDITNNMNLSDSWRQQSEDERWTKEGLVPVRGNLTISLTVLKNAAKEVIENLNQVL